VTYRRRARLLPTTERFSHARARYRLSRGCDESNERADSRFRRGIPRIRVIFKAESPFRRQRSEVYESVARTLGQQRAIKLEKPVTFDGHGGRTANNEITVFIP